MRGLGLQKNAVWVKLVSMLGIRFLLSILFFHNLGLTTKGLWIAASVAMASSTFVYLYILATADYSEVARKAVETKEDSKQVEETTPDNAVITP